MATCGLNALDDADALLTNSLPLESNSNTAQKKVITTTPQACDTHSTMLKLAFTM